MKNTFGFIGTGNMGGALAKAAAKAIAPEDLYLADSDTAKAAALAQTLGCQTASAVQIAENCGYIVLGVKPQMMEGLFADIAPVLAARQEPFVLISMAAAVAISEIRRMAGKDYPVIRIMPNMPVAVGSGVVMYDVTENVTEAQQARFLQTMRHVGLIDRIPEKLMDAGSAVSGCGPAFVALFLEALADGGVACGLPRKQAQEYAAYTLQGTARMLLESGMHPGQLKDAVCSPGGTTIAGVRALEQNGFRGAAMEAVEAAYRRTLELGK